MYVSIFQAKRFALIMSFGGSGAQVGALLPIISKGTTIVVGPVYDVYALAQAIQEEK